MSYITNTLGKDEKVELVIKQHWINYFWFGFFAFGILVGIAKYSETKEIKPILISALLTAYFFLRSFMREMVLTNQRAVKKVGVIAVKTSEIRKKQIENVSIDQGILQRLFGCGDIVIAGTGNTRFKFEDIKNPTEVKKSIEDILL